jgi:hypothetical protein
VKIALSSSPFNSATAFITHKKDTCARRLNRFFYQRSNAISGKSNRARRNFHFIAQVQRWKFLRISEISRLLLVLAIKSKCDFVSPFDFYPSVAFPR